ncbi:MAG TPA: hypothetical protein VHO90_00605 [Bacteroidales bacterium]|nr:hypothetical protein [Bacteroidales bacterium]
MKRRYNREIDLKRINKRVITFNNKEISVIDQYCKKYKIDNRSQFMREAIIKSILNKMDEDYPTLWDGYQLSLFTRY